MEQVNPAGRDSRRQRFRSASVREGPERASAHVVILHHDEQRPRLREENPVEAVRRVLAGDEIVISHSGASQYAIPGGGVSACGIAALNCLRVVFTKEQSGLRGEALLANIMSREVAEEITLICSQWSSKSHLEVDEIYKVPLFETSLYRVDSRFSQPTFEQFLGMLEVLQSGPTSDTSAAVIITRPPEIIACLKIVTDTKPVFIIFDSHPRPKHPGGAGFIFNVSREATAIHLHQLLAVESRLLANSDLRWQAQLLGSFSADIFVPRILLDSLGVSQIILESSLAILALKTQLADLKNENNSVSSENAQLHEENLRLRDNLKSTLAPRRQSERQNSDNGWISNAEEYLHWSPSSAGAGPSQRVSQQRHDGYVGRPSGSDKSRQQRSHDDRSSMQSAHQDRTPTKQNEQDEGMDEDLMLAQQLQLQFEEEDHHLRREYEALAKFEQNIFQCAICLDDKSDEDIALIERCEHACCRDCLRHYIIERLRERRFPIFCPICAADKSKRKPGVISQFVIQTVGIPEEAYAVFEELQMNAFSIFVECRKCKRSFYVDKDEFRESRFITCPLPRCRYVWCKGCQLPIDEKGPEHSCDGTNELTHLMQAQGWKRCPGCQTPIQKISGCNNMRCTTPGCNRNFCYGCGNSRCTCRG